MKYHQLRLGLRENDGLDLPQIYILKGLESSLRGDPCWQRGHKLSSSAAMWPAETLL